MKKISFFLIFLSGNLCFSEIVTHYEKSDCSKPDLKNKLWESIKPETISLMAQPMAIPRPNVTTTDKIVVRSIHDGKWMQLHLVWEDTEKNDGGKLGTFSDGVAIQVPVKDNPNPPPIFMGIKNDPVHILHWKSMFQEDKERGMRTPKDYYPNLSVDIYPFEFSDHGKLGKLPDEVKESFSTGKAAGNPQSYAKLNGLDEILAEGFGSSQVMDTTQPAGEQSTSEAKWENGKWTVIIARPLQRQKASQLNPGKKSHIAFAVWQGGKKEIGARKSVTMSWTPFTLDPIK